LPSDSGAIEAEILSILSKSQVAIVGTSSPVDDSAVRAAVTDLAKSVANARKFGSGDKVPIRGPRSNETSSLAEDLGEAVIDQGFDKALEFLFGKLAGGLIGGLLSGSDISKESELGPPRFIGKNDLEVIKRMRDLYFVLKSKGYRAKPEALPDGPVIGPGR